MSSEANTKDMSKLQSEIKQLNTKLTDTLRKLLDRTRLFDNVSLDLQEKKFECLSLKSELDSLALKNDQFEKTSNELETAKAELLAASKELELSNEKIANTTSQLEKLNIEYNKLRNDYDKLNFDYVDLQKEQIKKNDEADSIRGNLSLVIEQLLIFQTRYKEQKRELFLAKKECRQMKDSLKKSKTLIAKLEKNSIELSSLKKQSKNLQLELKNSRSMYDDVINLILSAKKEKKRSLSTHLSNIVIPSKRRFASLINILENTNYFNVNFYLRNNPDVALSDFSAAEHFLLYGADEMRNPSENFNCKEYLDMYPDVASSKLNPLIHYLLFGKEEGRKPLRKI